MNLLRSVDCAKSGIIPRIAHTHPTHPILRSKRYGDGGDSDDDDSGDDNAQIRLDDSISDRSDGEDAADESNATPDRRVHSNKRAAPTDNGAGGKKQRVSPRIVLPLPTDNNLPSSIGDVLHRLQTKSLALVQYDFLHEHRYLPVTAMQWENFRS